uniref:DUF7670 domain-containing protein n=1 Tax=candidate division CPR3 bacterium TaxID=2268181 RepID=A0A7C5UWM8_UNCC3
MKKWVIKKKSLNTVLLKKNNKFLYLLAQIVGYVTAIFLLLFGLLESLSNKETWSAGVVEALIFGGVVLLLVTISKRKLILGAVLLILEGIFVFVFPIIRTGEVHLTGFIIPAPMVLCGLLFLFSRQKRVGEVSQNKDSMAIK